MAEIKQPIRYGMVGGGQGAFIGGVHRIAARMDGEFQLVAGALSSNGDRARESGAELGLAADRSYTSFEEMAEKEAKRADGIEAVSIVTPNHLHFAVAKTFLEAGIHVICDKPLAGSLEDAQVLTDLVKGSGKLFVLTHNYTGYPLVRRARELVHNGDLGEIRVVQAEYAQEWLSENLEQTGQKQAAWRTDPARSGIGGAIGDIGTHAYHLLRFVTGLETESLCADLQCFGEGRVLDDNAHILLRFKGNSGGGKPRGMMWASQVAPGNENALRLRVYGTKGGLEWSQENPNHLLFSPLGQSTRIITRGGADAGALAGKATRIPAGHPEGYLEAFANIYQGAANAIRNFRNSPGAENSGLLPTISDGLEGMMFISACVASSKNDAAWISLSFPPEGHG